MASKEKNLSEYKMAVVSDTEKIKLGIVVSDWNENITSSLLDGALNTLRKHGMRDQNIHIIHVPGAYELTSGADLLLKSKNPDGVICLGCVIKGETRHDEYINNAVSQGLTMLSLKMNKPVIFGVLTTENMYQAVDRAGGKHGNKGIESAITALKMVHLYQTLSNPKSNIGF